MKYHEVTCWEPEEIETAKDIVRMLYNQYKQGFQKSPISRLDSHIFAKLRQREKTLEFEKYLESPIIVESNNEKLDLLEYWKNRTTEFPVLASIAKDFLACPATSAMVERIFSRSSLLLCAERQAMKNSTIRKLMCLDLWGRDDWKK
jgi:hypothetical protein